MFTVKGYIGGVSYAVQVAVEADAAPGATGIVSGSPSGIGLLQEYDGVPVSVTPTGPVVLGSVAERAGVLAVLLTKTQVTSVEGDDVPDLIGPVRPGLVY